MYLYIHTYNYVYIYIYICIVSRRRDGRLGRRLGEAMAEGGEMGGACYLRGGAF